MERKSIFDRIKVNKNTGLLVLPDLDDGIYSKEFIEKNHLVSLEEFKKLKRR